VAAKRRQSALFFFLGQDSTGLAMRVGSGYCESENFGTLFSGIVVYQGGRDSSFACGRVSPLFPTSPDMSRPCHKVYSLEVSGKTPSHLKHNAHRRQDNRLDLPSRAREGVTYTMQTGSVGRCYLGFILPRMKDQIQRPIGLLNPLRNCAYRTQEVVPFRNHWPGAESRR